MRSGLSSIVSVVYLVVGLIVASSHAFFGNLNALMPILGVDLHLR